MQNLKYKMIYKIRYKIIYKKRYEIRCDIKYLLQITTIYLILQAIINGDVFPLCSLSSYLIGRTKAQKATEVI